MGRGRHSKRPGGKRFGAFDGLLSFNLTIGADVFDDVIIIADRKGNRNYSGARHVAVAYRAGRLRRGPRRTSISH
jgi:hypothetical protein